MNDLQLVKTKNFGDVQCDFYKGKDDCYLTREQIGMSLEYSAPQEAIANIHFRHKDRLDQYSVNIKLISTDGKSYDTTVYNRKGVMEICRWSRQPKADEFIDFAWSVMDDVISGKARVVIDSPDSSIIESARLKASQDRAAAMLLNAKTRMYKTIMGTIGDKTLSPIAVQVFGLKTLEAVTGVDVGTVLPETEKHYSATEVGKMFNVSANKVGSLAKKNGVKTKEFGILVLDKSKYSNKEVESFRYNDRGVARIKELLAAQ